VSKISGLIGISKTSSRNENWEKIANKMGLDPKKLQRLVDPIVNVFAVTDHTKNLAFLLAEGVVPSNVREGYLTRLLIRRTHRLLSKFSIADKMQELVDMQIMFWSKDFPNLKEMREEILELLSIEIEKYGETLARGFEITKRFVRELRIKGNKNFPLEKLVDLYDSHGLSPEVVSEIIEAEGGEVNVPDNFYNYVAVRHTGERKIKSSSKKIVEPDIEIPNQLRTRTLFYENAYLKEFEAKVLFASNNCVVLDKTAFYPEGGGQPADYGYLEFKGKRSQVTDVIKNGNAIIHVLKGQIPKESDPIRGVIDWERRINLMRHHTGTHIINSAARQTLGNHVWQAGAQKSVDKTRLDISHPRRLTIKEIEKIETLANKTVMKNLPVDNIWISREEAEKRYGFRLYQGGVVPGREIRIVKTNDEDVEACGGTHCKTTGEVGFIKIISTERIQDGVERIIFSTGIPALKNVQKIEKRMSNIAGLLMVPKDKTERTLTRIVDEWKKFRHEKKQLEIELSKFMAKEYLKTPKNVSGLRVVSKIIYSKNNNIDLMINVTNEILKIDQKSVVVFIIVNNDARLIIRVGKDARKIGIDAQEIAKEAALILGGGGSGKPEFAQGGGSNIENANEALKKAEEIINKKVVEIQDF
jgi:alanyl-tRNA synthetase